MAHLLVQARFSRDSALPEDVVINTFHFDAVGLEVLGTGVAQRVIDFYDVSPNPPNLGALSTLMGSCLSSPMEVRVYNLDLPPPRIPIFTDTEAITLGSGQSLPAEVALVGSFEGTPVSGEPQARKRGRIFWGPLETETLAMSANNSDAVPSATAVSILNGAMQALEASNVADATWCVYSPTDDLLVPVVRGWVDNAFDTQRRRGIKATTRTLWP